MTTSPSTVVDSVDPRSSSPTTETSRTRSGALGHGRSRLGDGARSTVATNGDDRLPMLPSSGRRSRLPQLLLATLCIAGGGLGALLLFSQYDQREPVVVVAADVNVGTQLTREHLALSTAALDDGVLAVRSIDQVVGRVATHDLAAGELLAATDVADVGRRVTAEQSVVGLLLSPGAYPTRSLAPGDRVDAFAAGESSLGLIAEDLLVLEVLESSSDGRTLLVSVVAPDQADAAALVATDSDHGIRLTLRGEG